jgi:hypothetical protein
MAAEAYLVESLCRDALSKDDSATETTFAGVSKHYTDVLANIQCAPKDLDSITQQLCLLALLFDAKGATRSQASRAKADAATARRLRRLAESIRPGSCKEPGKPRQIARAQPVKRPARRRARRRRH